MKLTSSAKQVETQTHAPELTLQDHAGRVSRLSEIADETLVMLIVGIDCSSCVHAVDDMGAIASRYPDVHFLAVCIQSDCFARLSEFKAHTGGVIEVLAASSRAIREAFQIPASTWLLYPTLLCVDKDHCLRACITGKDEFTKNLAINLPPLLEEMGIKQAAAMEVVA